ncbi:MAG: hypothetical protein Q9217_006220 [Psora testacea]
MQLGKTLGILSLGATAIAGLAQKQVLITYPNDTPQSALESYRSAIQSAGGQILHEYVTHFRDQRLNNDRGFVVKASTEALETIHMLEQKHTPTIEEDKTVRIQDKGL